MNELSVQEAAEKLNVTRQAITAACRDGRLAAHKDARGRWRIAERDLFEDSRRW